MKKIIKKIVIYLVILFALFMTMTGAMLIKYDAVTFENFLRFIIPVGVIAWMLHLDGKLFYKKGDEEIKYSKTKFRVLSYVVIPCLVIIPFIILYVI